MSMEHWWNDVDRETGNREHERPCTYKCNIEARSHQFCCRAKEIITTCSECMPVAAFTQHTKRMRRVVLFRVACLALPYFFHFISQTTRFSGKSYWTLNVCFDFLYKSVCNMYHYNQNWARYDQNMYWFWCKVPVIIIVRFFWKLIFHDRFLKSNQISSLMKICSVRAELFHVDRWADR